MLTRCVLIALCGLLMAAASPSPAARSAFERGESALASGKLELAEAAYKEALRRTPRFAAANNGLGSVYFKQGKREEALAQFRLATKADASFALAFFNLGFCERKAGNFAAAATAYERYTALAPDDADGIFGLAESYRALAQDAKALSAYRRLVQRKGVPPAQKQLAQEAIATLERKLVAGGSAEAAPAEVRPASRLSEDDPATHPGSRPASRLREEPGAQEGLLTMLTGGPDETPANLQKKERATASQAEALSPGALPREPLRPNPRLSATRIAEGDRHLAQKRVREATFAYQDAVNAQPDSIEANFKLGSAYAQLGFYAQAIQRWNAVLALDPEPSVEKAARDNSARAEARLANPAEAGPVKALGTLPEVTRARARKAYEEGVARIGRRDYSGAIQSLSETLQLEPTLSVAFIARGSALVGLRRYSEAAADYHFALRLDPGLTAPLYGLGEAYRGLNRSREAKAFYERYAAASGADVRPELQKEAREKAARIR